MADFDLLRRHPVVFIIASIREVTANIFWEVSIKFKLSSIRLYKEWVCATILVLWQAILLRVVEFSNTLAGIRPDEESN